MNKNQLKKLTSFRFKRFARKTYSVFNSLNRVVTIGVLTGCTLSVAHASSVSSIEHIAIETSIDSIPPTELEEVIVTASKAELPLNLASKQVTVITSKEIERAPVRSIEDLLTYVTGVDISQRGPHGVQADISLRGGSFDQTAILINGINLTNPHTGHYSFDLPINLSDIERIEIVQGPTSLIYGASAFSGGVNIITKKDRETNLNAKFEGGMYGLLVTEARGAYKSETSLHTLSAGYKRSDGYISNSDYEIINFLWQSRFNLNGSTLDINAGLNDKNFGANTFYSAAYPNQFDDTRAIIFSVKGETSGKLKFIPHLYWNRHFDEFQLIRDGTPEVPSWYTGHNYHQSDIFGINLNLQYASKYGVTNFGGEIRNEGIMSNVLGKPMVNSIGKYNKSDNRTNLSYFTEHTYIYNRLTLSFGGLLNYNTAIIDKFKFYPALNGSFRATDKISIYSSWNKSTRMPTFTDLYYTTATHIGNSYLEAEESESLEVGLKYINPAITVTMSSFLMKGNNLIDWVKTDADALWESRNHTKIDTKGFETNINLDLKETIGPNQPFNSLSFGYMYLDQKMQETNLISNYRLNYLRQKFTASLQHDLTKNISFSWKYRWQDRVGSYIEYIDLKTGESVMYTPFGIVDIKVDYKLERINLFINANNILNSHQVDFGNIPQPGFWLSGGLTIKI